MPTYPPAIQHLTDYYDSLEIMLLDSRKAGEFHTHFGIAEACPEDYCFIRACALASRHPHLLEFLRRSARRLHERVFTPYPLAPGDRVLDVGFGAGGTLEQLAGRWPHARFEGINLNAQQYSIARALLERRDNVHLHYGDFLTTRFEPGFRLVYFIESAFHIADKEQLCRRLDEIGAHEVALVDIFLAERAARRLAGRGAAGIFSYLSVGGWRHELSRHGFEICAFEDLSAQVANTLVIRTPYAEFSSQVLAERFTSACGTGPLSERADEIYFGYRRLHRMLERGLARYGILRVRRAG